MQIITTSSQVITFIPRAYEVAYWVDVIDMVTNVTERVSRAATTSGNYKTIDINFSALATISLVQGRYYGVQVLNASTLDVVYRDDLFCEINSAQYTQHESDNTYTTL